MPLLATKKITRLLSIIMEKHGLFQPLFSARSRFVARDGIVRKPSPFWSIRKGPETSRVVTLIKAKLNLSMCLRAFVELGLKDDSRCIKYVLWWKLCTQIRSSFN